MSPIYRLGKKIAFPPPHMAEPDGLLAVGGDLSTKRLLTAYATGIFPWYSTGDPILWWSPDPRMIFLPGAVHCSRRLARVLRQGVFQITMDKAFPEVVSACASVRNEHRSGTWITPEMRDAYIRLHEAGFAHSVESWCGGELAGGLYGVSLGGAFFGESMFSLRPDASKAALVSLSTQLRAWGFTLVDCQLPNDHLVRMGGHQIPRSQFLAMLAKALEKPTRRGAWVGA